MTQQTILIVEDEPIIAADLEDRLRDLGYGIFASVASGEEALAALGSELPDLILMDVNLAGELDGVETALEIAKLGDVPLIFLTSNSDGATFTRARSARPRAFLSKPFRGRDLMNTISLAIGATQPMPAGESAVVMSDRLFLRVKERLSRLMVSDILWVEADDYYCKVVTEEREYLVTKTLKKFAALLPENGDFVRCHRSYIVNLRRVTEIGEIFVFIGKRQLPVSRSKRAELLRQLNNL